MKEISKLSKLQRFILLKAAERQPKCEEWAQARNRSREGFIAVGMMKPGGKTCEASDIQHITRNQILVEYFGFKMRKHRCGVNVFDDWDTSQISRKDVDPAKYNTANATLYRAIKRLEKRGLLLRMPPTMKRVSRYASRLKGNQGDMQLTEQGILAAGVIRGAIS